MSNAALVVRAVNPLLKDIYEMAKKNVQTKLGAWKAGGDSEQLARYYSRLCTVKTIWSRGQPVLIDDFYFPSKIEVTTLQRKSFSGGRRKQNLVERVSDLPPGCIVVEGIVGQGKSIFMRHLALSVLNDVSAKKLPLFVELRSIGDKTSLLDLLLQSLAALGAESHEDVFWYLAKQGKLILILDGFDEIEQKYVSRVLDYISDIRIGCPEIKLIVSSRPKNAIQSAPDFSVVKLCPLQESDHEEFLKKLGVECVRRAELMSAISQSSKDIREAISTPLMMSIVVLIYESVHQIPPYLSDFFSALFHVVFTQHDSSKQSFEREHNTGLSEAELQKLFEAFCFSVTQKAYGRTLSRGRFDECFSQALTYVPNVKCSVDDFRADVIGVACLMLEEGVGDATFLHKGIMDFFSAAFVVRLKEGGAVKFYHVAANNYSAWKGVLQFLHKIDERRYVEYYFLKKFYEDVSELSVVLAEADEKEFIKFLSGLFEMMQFTKEDITLRMRSKPIHRSEVSELLAEKCMENLDNEEMLSVSFGRYQELAVENRGVQIEFDEENQIVSFGIVTALRLFGTEKIREALGDVEAELSVRLQNAKDFLCEDEQLSAVIEMSLDEFS